MPIMPDHMTVGELIEELQRMPEESPVKMIDFDADMKEIHASINQVRIDLLSGEVHLVP